LPPELLGALPRPCLSGGRESPMDRALLAAVSHGGALANAVAQMVDRQHERPMGAERFAVKRAMSCTPCRGCHADILPGNIVIFCRRESSERPQPAHPACLPLIRGLTRPPGSGHDDVQFDSGLSHATRTAATAAIALLPATEARGSSGRSGNEQGESGRPRNGLQSRLQSRLHRGGDFTAEDYELLLQLDEPSRNRAVQAEEKCFQESLVAALPLSKVAPGGTISQCMICLDDMRVGSAVRTLPCMHVFHRKCIDRWLCEPGRKPRCPIDQAEVQLAPG